MNRNATTRFSNRVKDYVKYRPQYPASMFEYMRDEIGLRPEWAVADIGSGTGLSAIGFLKNGNTVIGVEPNSSMRNASEKYLSGFESFRALDGRSDVTGLDEDSVDLIFAGQSFHWFCNRESAAEFVRILKPGGFACLAWNERLLDCDRFHAEYEGLLNRFSTDYQNIRHDRITGESIKEAFSCEFNSVAFSNQQTFDLVGLMGRVLSSSYMPDGASRQFKSMKDNLNSLFAEFAENDRITVLYKTRLYYCKF